MLLASRDQKRNVALRDGPRRAPNGPAGAGEEAPTASLVAGLVPVVDRVSQSSTTGTGEVGDDAPGCGGRRLRSGRLRPRGAARGAAAAAGRAAGGLAGRARRRRLACRPRLLGRHALRRRPVRPAHPGDLQLGAGRDPDPRPRARGPAVHPPHDPQHGPAGAPAAPEARDGRVHPAAPRALHRRRRRPGPRPAGGRGRRRGVRPAPPGHRRLPAGQPRRAAWASPSPTGTCCSSGPTA